MIKEWLITGDTHGDFSRFDYLDELDNENTALIILGDAGWNFYLNKTDKKNKTNFHSNHKFTVYCVRGNHEERPDKIKNMIVKYDTDVDGYVYMEEEFPRIRYFIDGGSYNINGLSTLVIGGAYSVDKWYRLKGNPEDTNKWTGWFKDEQLAYEEREMIFRKALTLEKVDLLLTHTCPKRYIPTDLFLPMVDQDTVDTTTEVFLDKIWAIFVDKKSILLFGHYHANRAEAPRVEQYYKAIDSLDNIVRRWNDFDYENIKFKSFEDCIPVSPKFYDSQG